MSAGLNSVRKAALVLRILATFSPRGASLAEVCESSDLPKATAHRVLATLVAERLVERPTGTRLYRLGPELFAFGTSTSSMFDFRDVASASLKRISEKTGEMALLGIRSGYDALCLDMHEGERAPKGVLINLMDRWPLGVGVFSLAILAFLPAAEIAQILEYNERRLLHKSQYSAKRISVALGKVRCNKHVFLTFPALARSESKAGIAVPILDVMGRPIASLCVIATERRLRGEIRTQCVDMLAHEAALIANEYAYRPDEEVVEESWNLAIN